MARSTIWNEASALPVTLIDTHCHLDGYLSRGELPGVLERARAAGLESMIAVGTGPEDWALYRGLSAKHAGMVRYSAGLHPCHVDEGWKGALATLESFWGASAHRPLPVALGECGLDRFHLPKDSDEAARVFGWQQEAFRYQLEIAGRLKCPLIIHSRNAFTDTVKLIDESGVDWKRVVFHCFSEGAAEVAELVKRGGRASFTGILTYRNAPAVRDAARAQGLDRFMVETDAPYLAPMPHRGKTNEPAWVRHVAEYAAAEVFGVTLESLAATTTRNAREFFGIG
jgi:TatD DNase family protein